MLSKSMPPRPQGGFITLFALILAGVIISFIGLVWDGGSLIDSYRSADQIAAEAGRTAAECVDINSFLTTGQATVRDDATATACAQPYIDAVNAAPHEKSTITLVSAILSADWRSVTVTITVSKPLLFLSSLTFNNVATGHATVKLTQGVTDAGG